MISARCIIRIIVHLPHGVIRITRYAQDALNRAMAVTDPLTQTTSYGYDAVGNTIAITTPNNLVTSFVYDGANRVTSKTTPIGTTQYAYDNANNLTTVTNPALATQGFTYDAINRATQEDDRDSSSALVVSYLYGYDANSNRTQETETRPGNPNRITTYTYDKANRLGTTTDPNSNTTTYAYDAAGNQTNVTDPLGVTTIITPTQINLPGTVAHYQGSTLLDSTANGYDNVSRLANTTTTTGDNVTITNTLQYNGNNYLTTLALADQGSGASGSDSFSVAYTNANLVSGVTGVDGRPYVYDSANRLVCRDRLNGPDIAVWRYDGDGRRTDQYDGYFDPPLGGISCAWQLVDPNVGLHNRTQYQYSGNKLTSRSKDFYIAGSLSGHNNDSTYQYDAQGNVTQELRHDTDDNITSTVTYTWEPATQRLMGFTRNNGTSVFTTTLQYDSLNRIIARFTAPYSTTYTYVGDSDWLLKETKYPFDGSPVFDLVQYRYLSPKLMRVVMGSCNNAIFYLQYNWDGNYYRTYAPGGGTSLFPYYGDEWGVGWDVTPCSSTPAPTLAYRWHGQWGYMFFADLGLGLSGTKALGLYYVHGRWYNPEVGLWLSPDGKGEYFYGSGQDPANYARYRPSAFEGGSGSVSLVQSFSQSNCGALIGIGPKSTPITLIDPGRLGFKPGVNVDWLPYLFYQNPCDFRFTASVEYNPSALNWLGNWTTRNIGQGDVPDIPGVMERYPVLFGVSGYPNARYWTRDIQFLQNAVLPGFSSFWNVVPGKNEIREVFPLPLGYNMVALLDPVVGQEGLPAGMRDPLEVRDRSITLVPRDSYLPRIPIGGRGTLATVRFRTRSLGPRRLEIETVGEIGFFGNNFATFTLEGRYDPVYPTGVTLEDIFQ